MRLPAQALTRSCSVDAFSLLTLFCEFVTDLLRNNSAVVHYNSLARQLFESNGVPINDLYSDVMARCGEAGNKLGSYATCELNVDSCGWDPCCGPACTNGSMAGCPPGSCVSELFGNVH
eukprot:SAG11_NODE_1873_length_4150_cov_1.815354_1_plen_118_part_10